MSHIFISYSRSDIIFAGKIVQALADNELDTWIDWKSIPKGEDWEQEIYRGVEEADAFLFLISPDSVASQMCNKEIAHAVRNGKRILPIVIRDADLKIIHPEISKRNWIFCRDGKDDFNKATEETRKTIHTDYEWLKYHTELQVKALKWEQKKDDSRLLRGKELREAEQQLAEVSAQEDPQPTKLQREYILASQRNEVRTRRQIVISLSIVIVVMTIISIFAWIQRNDAQRQEKIALSRQLSLQSQSLFSNGNPKQQTSVLLAIESMHLLPNSEAALTLQNNTLAKPLAQMTHIGIVSIVAISPKGDFIASGGCDQWSPGNRFCTQGSIYVWEATTGKKISHMMHDGSILSIAFSPDQRYIVSGSGDGTACAWESVTGKKMACVEHGLAAVYSVAFSFDSRYVVSGGRDSRVRVWELVTGRETARMLHDSMVTSVAFSPNNKFIVSGSSDGTARVWDATTGQEIVRMKHDDVTNGDWISVAFSPDGKFIVSGSSDNTARIWETTTGKEIARMIHNGAVKFVNFSPNGKFIVSVCQDSARVWEVATRKEIARMEHADTVSSVAFSPDSKFVVSGSYDNTVRVLEINIGQEIARMTHNDGVTSVAFSPDGKSVVSGSWDNTVRIWESSLDKKLVRIIGNDGVVSVAFSPDGKSVVLGSRNGTASIWNITSAKELAHNNYNDRVIFVAFSLDGKFVVSGSWDDIIRMWDATTGNEITGIKTNDLSSVAISSDGKSVISGGADGVARVWNIATGKQVVSLDHNPLENNVVSYDDISFIDAVAFSPNGKFVVSGSGGKDNTVRIWEPTTGREILRLVQDGGVTSATVSPDSKYIAIGKCDQMLADSTCTQGSVRVLNAANGNEIAHMVLDKRVFSVLFSPDGKYVASGSGDNTVRVWEVATGIEVARMVHENTVYSVAFSPDGKYVISGSAEETAHIWMWRSEDMIADACSRVASNLTRVEWQHYIGDALPYQAVCPNLPIEPEITITPTP